MQAGGPWPRNRPDRWQHPTTRHGDPEVFPCPEGGVHRWFKDRVQRDGGRGKKTTIVALARKLLVALWKFASNGVVIEGALMKAA